jgi:transmembrane sensor
MSNLQTTHTATLIYKHLRNELTGTEQQELQAYVAASEANRSLVEQLTTPNTLAAELQSMYSYDQGSGWDKLTALRQSEGLYWEAARFNWRQFAAAAIIIGILLSLVYFWPNKLASKAKELFAQVHPLALLTGGNQPILTLHDNNIITLNAAAQTITDGPATIQWNGSDQLSYTMNTGGVPQGAASAALFNILSSPAHQAVQVRLADGSTIQLDSSSVINYPANHAGNERVVHLLTGTVLFNVTPDSLKPFRVQHGDIAIYAKGTRFTVSALPQYQQVRAELEEGVIEIRNRHYKVLLQPGQQAMVGNEGPITVTTSPLPLHPSPQSFRFHRDDFAATVRKLENWFGVKVVYTQAPPGIYTAHFNRHEPLNHILTAIGNNFRVNMHLEGKTVTVSNAR